MKDMFNAIWFILASLSTYTKLNTINHLHISWKYCMGLPTSAWWLKHGLVSIMVFLRNENSRETSHRYIIIHDHNTETNIGLAMTTQLLCHVQKFVAVALLKFCGVKWSLRFPPTCPIWTPGKCCINPDTIGSHLWNTNWNYAAAAWLCDRYHRVQVHKLLMSLHLKS